MNKNLYLVSVVRGGKRRTATMTAAEARSTVHDAVRIGYEVSCRPVTDADPIIIGVKVEPVDDKESR